ncbi:hypothetical protein DN524_33945, partial [Burkholderia multivorans]
MEVLRLTGPTQLRGTVDVRGAKNSVLKLMAASLLAVGRTTITNVPAILDVRIMVELLSRLGIVVDGAAEAAEEFDHDPHVEDRGNVGDRRASHSEQARRH